MPVDYIPHDVQGNQQVFEIEGDTQTINIGLTGPPRPK
jgi:hypothetical protein